MKISQFEFEAIGTKWQIDFYEDVAKTGKLKQQILNLIDDFDKTYSRFRADSLITTMSQSPGVYKLPENSEQLFIQYKKMYDLTNGKFTPLIGFTIEDAGYNSSYSLQPKPTIRKPVPWGQAIEYSYPDLTVNQPVLLDIGAAGKGYLVDLVDVAIQNSGIHSYSINAGGDITYRTNSDDTIQIGLEDPDNTSLAIGIVNLSNRSLCGSAGNRRTWDKYHHIIDPDLLESPSHIKAIWVVAESCLISDSLSTALFFVEPHEFSSYYDFDYAIIYKDRSLKISKDFPGEFFE